MSKKQKCSICGLERVNLEEHMKKHEDTTNNENVDIGEPDPRYASKTDINQLTDAITQIAKTVNELAQKQANPVIITKPEIEGTADLSKVKEPIEIPVMRGIEEGGIEKMPIPPTWRKMVDEILGMDFGIDVVYPQSGSGFLFKIIVPEEKSNASKSYKEFYKVDIRTKSVSYSDGVEGIRKFCELVKTNLAKKQ